MLAAMLAVQLFATGQQLLSKVVLSQGSFIFALMAYRHLVAALCVAPLAFFLERENSKKMEWSTWLWLFINALTGITAAMGLFYCGLRDTTATYSSNFLNIIPIVTFVFSIIFRIEKLGLGSKGGKIKTAGAILCVGGALTASLYKGKVFHLADGHHFHRPAVMEVSRSQWTRGTFMLVGSCVCYASWYILQGNAANMHHCVHTISSNRAMLKQEQGSLEIGVEFAADYNSLLAKRGPTYAPMFNPLALVFVAISEALVLGEQIRLGIVLGTVLIIVGLYSFLWGKRKELKCLPLSNEGVDEMATAVPESVELKSLAPV
ncbi:hypothetical protein Golob_001881 [Gossypium lobatum]|uniref:WAT1-related protein n=1 Tax=Gossypium lobatum TaxID=34289 RepID=A0A7J8N3R4_9ROSI|nr:hypothetical protein [Gossypium lobatum]